MPKAVFILLLISFFTLPVYSQVPEGKTVMTVGDIKVTAGEFRRMYLKSSIPDSAMPVDEYAELFALFKMKVAEAVQLGMDTTASFKNELKGYRDQLAANYLTDTAARNEVYRYAYQRMQKEIKASHILILCSPEASPADTLKAWNKADSLTRLVKSGEDFRKLAGIFSQDPSARINGGELGYFSAFQMIKPFEDAVYSCAPGEVKGPVRTAYGYHIIKVTDIRPASGRVKVAHIFRMVPRDATESENSKAKAVADTVYGLLKQGVSFSDLAKKYSEHRETAANGGELNWFGTGEIIPEIAEPAFSLRNIGDITQPVRSPYGWHILKLTDRKLPPTFSEARGFIETRVNEDAVEAIAKKNLVERLKKEYRYSLNRSSFNKFTGAADSLLITGADSIKAAEVPPGYIFSVNGNKVSNREFADYINSTREKGKLLSPEKFISGKLGSFTDQVLIRIENENLERKYPDFRYLVREFHDGILLFELSSRKIWDRAKSDTAGLKEYYAKNWTGSREKPFDEIKAELIPFYQEYLEKQWISQLKESYVVKTDRKVLEMLRKELEK